MFNMLLPHPAALVKTLKTRTLLIADPHIGWEIELQQKGIHVPSQTNKIFSKLTSILSKYTPNRLIILGDVKYTVVSSQRAEWQDIPEFFKNLKHYVTDITIVRGNHDANIQPLLPEDIQLLPATGEVIGDVGVFHGHKWPSPRLLRCKTLVMGHLHPTVVFHDPTGCRITKQVWLRANVDGKELAQVLLRKNNVKIVDSVEQTLEQHYNIKLKTSEIYIMPSFNDFLGGKPINETRKRKQSDTESLMGPVLRSAAVEMKESELYLLDGTYLGKLDQLKYL